MGHFLTKRQFLKPLVAVAALVVALLAGFALTTGSANADTVLVCIPVTSAQDTEVATGTNTWKVVRYVLPDGSYVDMSINALTVTQAQAYLIKRAVEVQYCRPSVTGGFPTP